jgi:hypothetical protein
VELGHEITPLDQDPYLNRLPTLLRKGQMHSLVGPGIAAYNRDLLDLAGRTKPDWLYVDQAVYLWPRTVARLRETGARLVHYTSEYLGSKRYWYWYRHFWPAATVYDAHIMTNEISRRLLEERGSKVIVMSEFGYDPAVHFPPALTEAERKAFATDLIFIGHWEPATERMILALRRAGISVKVWGRGWWRAWRLQDRADIRPIATKDYPKAIASANVALCFLSKWMRNQCCGRTFEIPAIGTLLLAERTPEQTSYFAEGKEAIFFGSSEELVEKARYCLRNQKERDAIARAGHDRCMRSGYTYKDRIKHDIEAVAERLSRTAVIPSRGQGALAKSI